MSDDDSVTTIAGREIVRIVKEKLRDIALDDRHPSASESHTFGGFRAFPSGATLARRIRGEPGS